MILHIYTQGIYTSFFGFLLGKIEAWERKKKKKCGSARQAATSASPSAAVCNTVISGDEVTECLHISIFIYYISLYCIFSAINPSLLLTLGTSSTVPGEGKTPGRSDSWQAQHLNIGPQCFFITLIIFYCA